MKLFRDKTIDILDSALAQIQLRELEARKSHEFRFADGLNSAWRVLVDTHAEYVNQKAKKNPIFRLGIWLGFKKARKAIREFDL